MRSTIRSPFAAETRLRVSKRVASSPGSISSHGSGSPASAVPAETIINSDASKVFVTARFSSVSSPRTVQLANGACKLVVLTWAFPDT